MFWHGLATGPHWVNIMKLLFASVLATAALAAPSAFAACQLWNVSGNALGLSQSNSTPVNFRIAQNGAVLSGRAQYYYQIRNAPILGFIERGSDPGRMDGVVEGAVRGSTVKLQVRWDNGSIGVYRMRIDEDGRFTGTTYDFTNPSSSADLLGRQRLTCRR